MFTAGLTTDVKELKRTGKASFIIALLGVIVPLFGGLGLAAAMGVGKGDKLACSPFLQHLFIGVVLTATSVCGYHRRYPWYHRIDPYHKPCRYKRSRCNSSY